MIALPHWDDSPYWARWLAQDSDGEWWWFENEPNAHRSHGFWVTGPENGRTVWSRTTCCCGDWTLTKQRYGADNKKPAVSDDRAGPEQH